MALYNLKLKEKRISKTTKAIKMANEIIKHIQQGIGVIGGTVKRRERKIIRETDRTLMSRKSLCYIHRNPQISPIDILEYNLPYQTPPESLEKIFPQISYVSGLAIANPIARYLMYEFEIERINEETLGELVKKPKLPIIVDVEPTNNEKIYWLKAEDFRIMTERPRWVLKIVNYEFPTMEFFWIAKTKDGHFRRIPHSKAVKYLPKYFVPVANGIEWMVDYGILSILQNPFDKTKRIVLVGGAHWLSTFAVNAAILLCQRIPEKKIEIEGSIESMSWLYNVIKKKKIDYFEALFKVTDTYYSRKRKIEIDPLGLFILQEVA